MTSVVTIVSNSKENRASMVKTGRPPIDGKTKDTTFQFRLSKEEQSHFKVLCEKLGYSKSGLMRYALKYLFAFTPGEFPEPEKPVNEFVLDGLSETESLFPKGKKILLLKEGHRIIIRVYGLVLSWDEKDELGRLSVMSVDCSEIVSHIEKLAHKHKALLFVFDSAYGRR